jgi:hypothetical protein
MNHHHRKTRSALFAHPVSGNLDPKHLFAALAAFGAEIHHGGHGQVRISLNGHSQGFHDTHHRLSKAEVVELRKFLASAGVARGRDFPE